MLFTKHFVSAALLNALPNGLCFNPFKKPCLIGIIVYVFLMRKLSPAKVK